MMITQAYLQAKMSYDALTGELLWKDRPADVATVCTMRNGRMKAQLFGKWVQMSQLVWMYFMGDKPVARIAYVSTDYLDNRIENLRDASLTPESSNARVIWDGDAQQWTVVIGRFDDHASAVKIADLLS